MQVTIKGLDNLTRQISEVQEAISGLDGEIAVLRFNPQDEQDIQRAIRQMEQAVDAKVSVHRNNPTVQNIVEGVKQRFREEISSRAKAAR